MSRLSQGEREPFDPLFRALYPRACRLARTRLPQDQAADVAQTIMMKVFARASEFEAGKPVLPWFYAVAGNELHAAQRRNTAQAKRTVEEGRAHTLEDPTNPEQLAVDRELRTSLHRAVAHLDEASAEAITCMLEGRTPPKVGALAFRKRVSRAYSKLRGLLEGLHAK